MVDIIVIFFIVVLFIISMTLYSSTNKLEADLLIASTLIPEVSVESQFKPQKKKWEILRRFLFDWLTPGIQASTMGESQPFTVKYSGSSLIPLKVYQGDSHNITITLQPIRKQPLENPITVKAQKQGDKVNFALALSNKTEFLEIEMIAAGFSFDGDKKQRQPMIANSLRYQWNCLFEKSGVHIFAFIFRVIDDSGVTMQIGQVEQTVKVVQIDHLTQRQVWILATSAGILSGALTLAEILKNLGIW